MYLRLDIHSHFANSMSLGSREGGGGHAPPPQLPVELALAFVSSICAALLFLDLSHRE